MQDGKWGKAFVKREFAGRNNNVEVKNIHNLTIKLTGNRRIEGKNHQNTRSRHRKHRATLLKYCRGTQGRPERVRKATQRQRPYSWSREKIVLAYEGRDARSTKGKRCTHWASPIKNQRSRRPHRQWSEKSASVLTSNIIREGINDQLIPNQCRLPQPTTSKDHSKKLNTDLNSQESPRRDCQN